MEESKMALVISSRCVGVKSGECLDACPVDCIHPRRDEPGFAEADQLFINPAECISCGACEPACPVEAITHESEASPEDRARNENYFKK